MEKSTVSALIAAGAAVVATVAQVLVLKCAKRKRAEREEAAREEARQPAAGAPERRDDV
jgi:hypothetical protein